MALKMCRNLLISVLCINITLFSCPVLAETTSGYKLDLRITSVLEGETVPFTGILLTTDSMTKIKLDFEKQLAELNLQFEYSKKESLLKLTVLEDRLEQETSFRITQIELRDAYIKELETKFLEKDDFSPWWITASFLVGCLTTIAIAYSLESAYR